MLPSNIITHHCNFPGKYHRFCTVSPSNPLKAKMKFTVLLAFALTAVAVASPIAEPELVKRGYLFFFGFQTQRYAKRSIGALGSCKGDCSNLAYRKCKSSCGTSNACYSACYPNVLNGCIRDYC